ncbi:Ephrin type-A receptor 4 [Ceratobasidium sp. AG-Ba]|nr:Ephrin type-A receptor 4 [Ceratobasidium sp. AG-Ba]
MVSPWVERGSLFKYLEDRPRLNRPQLCMKIADGLSFLHENRVVHGDLKGANVLVSDAEEPLIADFGNAIVHERTLQFTHSITKCNLSPRWTAPEVLAEGLCTAEADVYALGMTILEVITGKVPYPELKDLAVILAVVQKRFPTRPEEHISSASTEGDSLWQLLVQCWDFEPAARPTAKAVKDALESITPEGLVYYRLLAPSSPIDDVAGPFLYI